MGRDVDSRSREEGTPDFYLKQKTPLYVGDEKKTTNRLYSYMTANRCYIQDKKKKQDGCWHRAESIEYDIATEVNSYVPTKKCTTRNPLIKSSQNFFI